MRRACPALALGLLAGVAGCATAAPQAHVRAALASAEHRAAAGGRAQPHVAAFGGRSQRAAHGRWFAGRWHTPPAQQYIRFVRKYLRERIWKRPYFQQP